MSNLYQIRALHIGIEVFGVDLNQPLSNAVKNMIMKDVTKHRIVVFRNQVGKLFFCFPTKYLLDRVL